MGSNLANMVLVLLSEAMQQARLACPVRTKNEEHFTSFYLELGDLWVLSRKI